MSKNQATCFANKHSNSGKPSKNVRMCVYLSSGEKLANEKSPAKDCGLASFFLAMLLSAHLPTQETGEASGDEEHEQEDKHVHVK